MPTKLSLALLACLVSGCAGMSNPLHTEAPKACIKSCSDGSVASYIASKCDPTPCSGHADPAAPPRRDPPARPGPSS